MTEVASKTHNPQASYLTVAQPRRLLKAAKQSAAARGAWEDLGAVFGIALIIAVIALILLADRLPLAGSRFDRLAQRLVVRTSAPPNLSQHLLHGRLEIPNCQAMVDDLTQRKLRAVRCAHKCSQAAFIASREKDNKENTPWISTGVH